MTQTADEARIVWRPSAAAIERAHLGGVLRENGVADYAALLTLLEQDDAFERFYERLITKLDFDWLAPWSRLLDRSRGTPFAEWFVDAKFNATANCLDRWIDRGRGDELALISDDESGDSRRYSFVELRDEVRRLAGALRALGAAAGTTIGISLPMIPEAAIALLAIGYIGAIAVPAFSGYGPQALSARLNDAGAEILLTTDAMIRRGRRISNLDGLSEVIESVATLRHVIVTCDDFATVQAAALQSTTTKIHDWHTLCAGASSVASASPTAASDLQLLLYTSGSTGKPKGVVHSHAGFAIKAAIDQYLCFDLNPGERMLWYTDMGWMMGPWLVLGTLMLGATVVLYDGTPDFPSPDRLWQTCAAHRVTHLGVAPTAIRSLAAHGETYPQRHDLASLRILGSTGEAWNTAPYLWFLEHIGGNRAPIINYSGGTEIGGGILGAFPTMPLGPNAFHGPIPGMRADVVNSDGKALHGEVGELILRASWPGMTRSLWGGSAALRDDARYLQAYWERIPDVWSQGDWADIEDVDAGDALQRLWYIRGRSDDTIKIAGKRVGPAEFESALVDDPTVREAVAIGVPDELKGDVVVCLVVVKDRERENDELRSTLMKRIERALGHALRPKAIRFVDELPHTRNMKILRRIARARYLGLPSLGDLSGLENPSSLAAIDASR